MQHSDTFAYSRIPGSARPHALPRAAATGAAKTRLPAVRAAGAAVWRRRHLGLPPDGFRAERPIDGR
jgi:hypothetical protein